MENKKLFVLDRCMVCQAKLLYKGCPYCENGYSYVEISDKSLKQWFLSLDEQRKQEVLALFKQ